MTSLRVLVARLRDWLQGRRRDEELQEEIEAHLELLVEEHMRRGKSPPEAWSAARRDFGGIEQVKEAHRDSRRLPFLSGLWHDLRFAARLLVKERSFALVAVLTLGLGIGAANTVFTFVNAVRLRGLPVDEPHRVLKVYTRDASSRPTPVSHEDFENLRDARTFLGLAAYRRWASTLTDHKRAPEQVQSLYISANGFRLLRAAPVLGRDFLPEDDLPGSPPVALLGEGLWKRRFAANPAVVGRAIEIDGRNTIVIGVMPAGFAFDYFAELWLPLGLLPSVVGERRNERALNVFGRLAEEFRLSQSQAEVSAIAARIAEEDPIGHRDFRLTAEPFTGTLSSDPVMPALLGAVGFVLLIGCANVGNLLLARSARRSREISIRLAIGGTRYRIFRQLLVESALLSVLAGFLGLGLSYLGVRLFASSIEDIAMPYWIHFTMDARVFCFVAVVSLTTVVAFGLGPALHLTKTNLASSRASAGTARARRWTESLVVVELALTLVLLAGAALMLRSFLTLYRLDRAIETSQMTTMALVLPEPKYPDPERWTIFYGALEERLNGIPALSSATFASAPPFAGAASRELVIEGRPSDSARPLSKVSSVTIGSRYFETLGLPLVRGRSPSERDRAVVNELFASSYFPGEEPMGRRIGLAAPGADVTWVTIVGIAPTLRQNPAQKPDPVVYLPYRAAPQPSAWLIVRSPLSVSAVISLLREEVQALDRDLPLARIMAMDQLLSQSRWPHRVFSVTFAVFASIAIVFSSVGLYAVVACLVMRSTREIGVRMAFGAQSRQVVWLIGRFLVIPISLGLTLGLLGGLGVGMLLESVLVHTSSRDPVMLASPATLLLIVSAAACFYPARRATRLDPVIALRHE